MSLTKIFSIPAIWKIIKTSKLTNKKVHKTAFGKNAKKVTVTLPKMKGKKKAAYKKMLRTKGLKAAKIK